MWYEGTFEGYWWQAKVYDEGSMFGIDGGRISKLSICKGKKWSRKDCIYNYDRGLEFDNLPKGDLQRVIEHILGEVE